MKRIKCWLEGSSVGVMQIAAICILFVGMPAPKAEALIIGSHFTFYMEANCEGVPLGWSGMDAGLAFNFGARSAQDSRGCNNIESSPFWSKAACLGAAGAMWGAVGGALAAIAGAATGIVVAGTVVVTITAGQAVAALGLAAGAGAIFHAAVPDYSCQVRFV